MEYNKVYCKNCQRWYGYGINQCEIPSCGIQFTEYGYRSKEEFQRKMDYYRAVGIIPKIDEKGIDFIRTHMQHIHFADSKKNKIYGCPSELNKNNDCYFYLPTNKSCSKKFFKNIYNICHNLKRLLSS